jgi:hypothetical protein
MKFEFVPVTSWPALAWLARCHRSSSSVTVYHGSSVETADEWFCEAAWAGEYQSGDFDETDVVAGTGGRVRHGRVVFVSSGSTVDRLNAIELDDDVWISNSFSCLLAATKAELDPSYSLYFRHFRTIVRGIRSYSRFLPTSRGPVQHVYFDNLVWDGRTIRVQPKPGLGRDFSSFLRFREFLESSMRLMAANLTSPLRRNPYAMLSTASSGYDSSTATVLARQVGCDLVLCVDRDRTGDNDSGEPLAEVLGMQVVKARLRAWRETELPEVPFLASDSHGGDVFFKSAEPVLAGKVLFTGFHGGKMWDTHPKDLSDNIVRGDQSGLSMTEYRLMAGFLHCPVPFWGVRQIRDVNAISKSPELSPWNVEGDYNRPICRRIIEEAGVPREMFGREKKASWVLFIVSNEFMTARSAQSYLEWLRDNRGAWIRRGRVPPIPSLQVDQLELNGRRMFRLNGVSGHKLTLVDRARAAISERPTRLRRHIFPWAVAHLRAQYPLPE